MASGLPIVAIRTSSIPAVVRKAAVLVDEPNSQRFADTIELTLTDSTLRDMLSHLGKEVAKSFSWCKTAFQTLNLYKELQE